MTFLWKHSVLQQIFFFCIHIFVFLCFITPCKKRCEYNVCELLSVNDSWTFCFSLYLSYHQIIITGYITNECIRVNSNKKKHLQQQQPKEKYSQLTSYGGAFTPRSHIKRRPLKWVLSISIFIRKIFKYKESSFLKTRVYWSRIHLNEIERRSAETIAKK